jgi:glutamyl/glutaminyl-tRNA synthetase
MKITHVIRGEDHISNTPKQIVIQELLGLPTPNYAHLPMILGPDRSKLSSRHGAMGLNEYKKMGYLPEAMNNFLAFLGWHPLGDKEIFNLEELIDKFDLNRVQKGGAIFEIKRLDWFNAQHLKILSVDQLFDKIGEYIKTFSKTPKILDNYSPEYIKKVIELETPRLTKLSDFLEFSEFFFQENIDYPKEYLKWKTMEEIEIPTSLKDCLAVLEKIPEKEFNKANIETSFYNFISESYLYKKDKGRLLWPLRVALSGKKASPGPFEIAEILGKEESIKRVNFALSKLNS